MIGPLDGKHILFRAPTIDGSTFYYYKGSHSIVLLALVDAKYNYVDENGRVSDGGVFQQSSLILPKRNKPVPYVMLADAAFPWGDHILKPLPFRKLTNEQRIFYYRLSRGRRVVENSTTSLMKVLYLGKIIKLEIIFTSWEPTKNYSISYCLVITIVNVYHINKLFVFFLSS